MLCSLLSDAGGDGVRDAEMAAEEIAERHLSAGGGGRELDMT